jgi:hypothetical protein
MTGQQQLFGHIKDENGLHAMEGDPVPQFGGANKEESAGLPKEIAAVREPRCRGDRDRAGIDCH